MASKTISLREETYERLAREKGEGESFSDVVDRLVGVRESGHPLEDLVGLLDDPDVETLRDRFREAVEGRLGP